jgi:hypothetical protein
MRVFKTRWFARFAGRERVADESLSEAIERAERGIVDADLGEGAIKQRVARKGQGRSGGYRAIVAYRVGDRAVFLFGFAKNEMDNIGLDRVRKWRAAAAQVLSLDLDGLANASDDESLEEIDHEEDFSG